MMPSVEEVQKKVPGESETRVRSWQPPIKTTVSSDFRFRFFSLGKTATTDAELGKTVWCLDNCCIYDFRKRGTRLNQATLPIEMTHHSHRCEPIFRPTFTLFETGIKNQHYLPHTVHLPNSRQHDKQKHAVEHSMPQRSTYLLAAGHSLCSSTRAMSRSNDRNEASRGARNKCRVFCCE